MSDAELTKLIMEKTGAERSLIHYYIKLDEEGIKNVKFKTQRALKIIRLVESRDE